MKRSGKFYRRNEAEVMRSLGLEPTPNSGSGWIVKEDGQSEDVICQLKSTDATSIRVQKKDLDVLNYNAQVAHKLPVFAIQFLGTNEVYLLVKPDQLSEAAKYIECGAYERTANEFLGVEDLNNSRELSVRSDKTVKSSKNAREKFAKENEKKFMKEKRSAK